MRPAIDELAGFVDPERRRPDLAVHLLKEDDRHLIRPQRGLAFWKFAAVRFLDASQQPQHQVLAVVLEQEHATVVHRLGEEIAEFYLHPWMEVKLGLLNGGNPGTVGIDGCNHDRQEL